LRKIRTGIIGTGFSAISHIEAIARIPNIEVVAIVSSSEERGKRFAQKCGIEKTYTNPSDLINNTNVDVIHNCTPNHLHFPINKEVLIAGKHLLCEKPLALTSKESEELCQLSKKNKVVSGVCFNYRHYPLIQQARIGIATGEYGKVNSVFGGYFQDWLLYDTDYNWRLDPKVNGASRAIADIGSHWCDTIQHVLGKKITEVFADLKTVYPVRKKSAENNGTFSNLQEGTVEEVPIETEDYGSVLLHFEDGTHGVFTVSQVSAGHKNNLFFDIATQKTSLSWKQEDPNKLWIGKRNEPNMELLRDPATLYREAAKISHYPGGHQEGWPDGLKNLLIDFYSTIMDKDQYRSSNIFATFEDGHRMMQIIEAILESHKTKKWVEIKK
jgi:predicted dehydrogenase